MYSLLKRLPFLLTFFLFLVACSSSPATPPTSSEDIHYVASVDIDSSISQAELEVTYGGQTILYKPEAGFAVLGFSKEAGELTTLTTTLNEDTFGAPEVSASGTSVWASGWSAWASGWSAWASGWSAWASGWSAWAGGWDLWNNGSSQDGPNSNKDAFDQIKLDEAHAISRNFGEGITVAVLDTGIDPNHTMFSGRLVSSSQWKDYIDNDSNPSEATSGNARGHGTSAAGIVLQIAPRAKILPIRVLDGNGLGDTDDIILAIDHAVSSGVDIINFSAGTDVYLPALQAMITYANNQGVYVVASSGNNGNGGLTTYPAKSATKGDYAKLISVSSVDKADKPSSFASFDADLQYFAPGEDIRTAFPGNQTTKTKGTSFAAPIMSGALALAKSEVSASYHNRLNKYLQSSADSIGWRDGRLNIEKLIRALPGFTEPTYQLVNTRSGKCIEVNSASQINVYQYTCDAYHGQLWKVLMDGDTYKIINNSTGKALDVEASGMHSTANVVQYTYYGTDNQKWYLRPKGDAYQIVAKHSGMCLHIYNGSYSNNANVDQYACNDMNSQQFELRRNN